MRLLLVFVVLPMLVPWPAMGRPLRIVTLNVWGSKIRRPARLRVIARELRRLRPDVVALQEASEHIVGVLKKRTRLRAFYRSSYKDHRWEVGAALLARRRIAKPAVRQLPVQPPDTEARIALCARVATPIGPAEICNVHLSHRPEDGAVRSRQLELADRILRERPAARLRLLVGDFNAAATSPEVRRLIAGRPTEGAPCYLDAFASARPGDPGFTWDNRNPNIRFWKESDRRLDYVLVAGRRRDGVCAISGVRVSHARLVFDRPDGGVYASDHFGVLVELRKEKARPPPRRSRRASSPLERTSVGSALPNRELPGQLGVGACRWREIQDP